MSFQRIGDNLYNILDSFTGENVNYQKVTIFQDGTPMLDSDCDGYIYRKLNGEYFKRVLVNAEISVKYFGAKGDGIANDTSSIQTAINTISNIGGGTISFPYGTYNITSLQPKARVKLQGSNFAVLQSISATSEDLFKRADDSTTITRFGLEGFVLKGKKSGFTYTSGTALNLAGIANSNYKNLAISDFGKAGILLAQAHSGEQGGNFSTCIKDGNYNSFVDVSLGACGVNLTGFDAGTAVWFGYKANSNNFTGLFIKGTTKCGINFNWGNNNSIFGGTIESVDNYGILFRNSNNPDGSPIDGTNVTGNNLYGVRFENIGTSGNDACVYFGTNVSNNIILSNYASTIFQFKYEEGNNFNTILSANEISLKLVSTTNPEAAQRLNEIAPYGANNRLTVRRRDGDIELPTFFRLHNSSITVATDQLLHSHEFYTADTSTGGATVNAEIRSYADDTAGAIRLELWTGGGTKGTIAKRLSIKANGQIIPELSVYASNALAISGGLAQNVLYKDGSGNIKYVL